MTAPDGGVLTFPRAVRLVRKRLKWTQAQLGEHLYVSGDAVSRWETSVARPEPGSLEQLRRFARSLPYEVGAELRIVLGDDVVPPTNGVEEALHKAAEQLDVKSRLFRQALDGVLAAVQQAGMSVADARKAIAAAPK